MKESATPRPVVIGVDGSKAATRAAVWAVDEAIGRDAPLRLVCAVEPDDNRETGRDDAAGGPVTANTAIGHARMAIEAVGRPVKIETEIAYGPATASLVSASASAAMVCVGAVGLRHFRPGRVGSTAAALATSARCPVAIVRARDGPPHRPAGRILVEVDGFPDNGVLLGAAIEEAGVRDAALQVIVCRPTPPGGRGAADSEGDRGALADLDRRLARWKRHHPQLRVESTAVRGSLLEYLAYQHRSVGLVIVGAHDRQHVSELVGPAGSAILQDADCSLLIVNQRHL